MQFCWHFLVIVTAVLFGMCLYQKGEMTPDMSADQAAEAVMYRNYAYMLWGFALVVIIYCYYVHRESYTANMYGSATHTQTRRPLSVRTPFGLPGSRRAYMCGNKANMCGGGALVGDVY